MRLTRITLVAIALIIGLGFGRLVHFLLQDVEAQTYQATEEVLAEVAVVLASLPVSTAALRDGLDAAKRREFEASIYVLNKTSVGMDVYITARQGIVVFDSNGGTLEGEDLSRYNDVYLTLQGGYGARATRSDPKDSRTSTLYVAAPILDERDEITGVLTVSKPKLDSFVFVTERQRSIFWESMIIGGSVIAMVAICFGWLFRPIGRLTNYANEISAGERPQPPKLGFGKEVNTLGKALVQMRESLEGRQYTEQYVQTLTHELKSPLAGIRGAAELLGESEMPAGRREEFLQNILHECSRSERIIERLFELAELEGKTHLERSEEIDLWEIGSELAQELEPRFSPKGLKIKLPSQSEEAFTVSGERAMLSSAIENLFENAASFSPVGGEISVQLSKISEKELQFSVVDEGEGIPFFAKDRVFEKFYSLGKGGAAGKSSGLGLALVKEAINLHGGSAFVETADTGGACVGFRLPVT